MIDNAGFRENVGIILCNEHGQVCLCSRLGKRHGWQLPQGGFDDGETPEQAMYRELHEEIGLQKSDVKILARTKDWLHYVLPLAYRRQPSPGNPQCIGQKQIWFLLQLTAAESAIDFNCHDSPEFDQWQWVDYWQPVESVVAFKREVYKRALQQLAHALPTQR